MELKRGRFVLPFDRWPNLFIDRMSSKHSVNFGVDNFCRSPRNRVHGALTFKALENHMRRLGWWRWELRLESMTGGRCNRLNLHFWSPYLFQLTLLVFLVHFPCNPSSSKQRVLHYGPPPPLRGPTVWMFTWGMCAKCTLFWSVAKCFLEFETLKCTKLLIAKYCYFHQTK